MSGVCHIRSAAWPIDMLIEFGIINHLEAAQQKHPTLAVVKRKRDNESW